MKNKKDISEHDKKVIERIIDDKFENFRGFICRREDIEINPFFKQIKVLSDKERLRKISKPKVINYDE